MDTPDFRVKYKRAVKKIKKRHDKNQAMEIAIGGDFDAVGILERELIIFHGLRVNDYVIDVGCGSGRLARPLSEYLQGKYLGIDIVPDFINHSRTIVNRPDWRFELTNGLVIPEENELADMVCFFSVFTHLFHEHSYKYLQEAKRVLKPGGKIIFSFLEFKISCHWRLFMDALKNHDMSYPITMFLDRDAIRAWTEHLGLNILNIIDGDKPHIPIPHPVTFTDGTTVEKKGKLGPIGQSVCVLSK